MPVSGELRHPPRQGEPFPAASAAAHDPRASRALVFRRLRRVRRSPAGRDHRGLAGRGGWRARHGRARTGRVARGVGGRPRGSDRRELVIASAIALVIMAALSLVVGWLVAGRYLRPLRAITATTREISATNLHERLNLGGPEDELKELADTSTSCSTASSAPSRSSASSSPTPRTSSARRSRGCERRSTWPWRSPGPCPAQFDARRPPAPRARPGRPAARKLPHARPQPAGGSARPGDGLARRARPPRDRAPSRCDRGTRTAGQPAAWSRRVGLRKRDATLAHGRECDRQLRRAQPARRLGHGHHCGRERRARLVVENGGPALAPGEVAQLTETLPPHRRRAHPMDEGAGLGLAIAAQSWRCTTVRFNSTRSQMEGCASRSRCPPARAAGAA